MYKNQILSKNIRKTAFLVSKRLFSGTRGGNRTHKDSLGGSYYIHLITHANIQILAYYWLDRALPLLGDKLSVKVYKRCIKLIFDCFVTTYSVLYPIKTLYIVVFDGYVTPLGGPCNIHFTTETYLYRNMPLWLLC